MRLTIRTSENMERYTGKSYLPSMMCSQEIVHNHNTLGKKSVGIDISTTTKGKRKETHTGVSLNGGTPKSSISIGISIINHPFWGFSPYFWKHPHTMQHKKKHLFQLFENRVTLEDIGAHVCDATTGCHPWFSSLIRPEGFCTCLEGLPRWRKTHLPKPQCFRFYVICLRGMYCIVDCRVDDFHSIRNPKDLE